MPVCTKRSGYHKAQMSPCTLYGLAVTAALVDGVSLVTFLEAADWARASTPARHYFFTCITNTDHHQDSIQSAVLVLSE